MGKVSRRSKRRTSNKRSKRSTSVRKSKRSKRSKRRVSKKRVSKRTSRRTRSKRRVSKRTSKKKRISKHKSRQFRKHINIGGAAWDDQLTFERRAMRSGNTVKQEKAAYLARKKEKKRIAGYVTAEQERDATAQTVRKSDEQAAKSAIRTRAGRPPVEQARRDSAVAHRSNLTEIENHIRNPCRSQEDALQNCKDDNPTQYVEPILGLKGANPTQDGDPLEPFIVWRT